MKTESAEMLTSLDTLSTVYTNNNPANRRQLRTTIEQRGIATNRKFLEAADVVLQVGVDELVVFFMVVVYCMLPWYNKVT